jgi:hypothetical protein
LHPVETVLSGHLKYPLRQAKRILRFLAEYAPIIPQELFLIAAVLPYPGDRMLDVAVVWSGEAKRGERALKPMRTFLKPFEDTIQVNPYLEEQRSGTGSPADGDYCSHRKSILLPLEIEPPIVQGRMTCEVANGRRATAGRSPALDGQASCSLDNQLAQG